MSAKVPRLILMAFALSPSLGWALGLGEIHLHSALNEPMRAEIDLIGATPEELTALRASLAQREAFTRYGIDRPPFLSTLEFKVGKSKEKRDVLFVTSTDAIPEPFVTFLVEVNWSRGRLMREYTLLLDPPVYSPGESATSSASVAAATTAPAATAAPATPAMPAAPTNARGKGAAVQPTISPPPIAAEAAPETASAPVPAVTEATALPEKIAASGTYRVNAGDTLTKIARSLNAKNRAEIDLTMIALFRDNPRAFDGNINILRRGAILRVPGADEIAALNQQEAISEVNKQMSAWRSRAGALADGGHLRLVTPKANGGTLGTGTAPSSEAVGAPPPATAASNSEAQALKDRESKAAQQRLIDIHNAELKALQEKAAQNALPTPVAPQQPVAPPPAMTPPLNAAPPSTPTEASAAQPPTPPLATAAPKKPTAAKPAPVSSGSWLDVITDNWMIPVGAILALVAGVLFVRVRKRQQAQVGSFPAMEPTDDGGGSDTTAKILGIRKGDDSFLVEESGEHPAPDFTREPSVEPVAKSTEDTLSSESAVNLDQGDPLAEADFHMAYGLYDQAADLVRIALDREPDRRDLRLKLLEIYFVWGNKDAFLQTAKVLEASRDRAPAGEWDKIVIMGKQICPDEPLFTKATGGGRGAGALVDLNLEGGENRIDIDLFGDPEGERSSLDHSIAKETGDTEQTGESPQLHASNAGLDFMLDAPERGADTSATTREMPPRDEPTVESEVMKYADSPTRESPAVKTTSIRDRISNKLGTVGTEQTAEVSIDDLGLDLEGLDEAGADSAKVRQLEETDHPDDAPTMVAGLDERSRRMIADAESRSRDRDLTELERELEASFISELESSQEEIKTAVIGPESAPTVQMPRDLDSAATSRFKAPEYTDKLEAVHGDPDSTSKLRSINADSVDLDLDRLATALGGGDTLEQPRAAEEVFSTEVFEASQRSRRVDLDVGDAINGSDALTPGVRTQNGSGKLQSTAASPAAAPEFEPVTMSEVGTKLDLARAYMDMGDPEGARNILDEVVQEGSASQKQEAQRLIQSLPG